jgi:hypothetical protein
MGKGIECGSEGGIEPQRHDVRREQETDSEDEAFQVISLSAEIGLCVSFTSFLFVRRAVVVKDAL